MLDFSTVLADSGLDADPNGTLARIVRESNNHEKKASGLTTQVTGLDTQVSELTDSVDKLTQKNSDTHNANRNHRQTAEGELSNQKKDFDIQLAGETAKTSELTGRVTELEAELKISVDSHKTLQDQHGITTKALEVHESRDLTRKRRTELGKIDSPIREGLHNTVYAQIEHFMVYDKDGGFDLKDSNGKDLKKDGKLVEVTDLLNDVNSKTPTWALDGMPGAFIKQGKEPSSLLQGEGNIRTMDEPLDTSVSGNDIREQSRKRRKS